MPEIEMMGHEPAGGAVEHLYIWCGGRICQKREDDGETVVRSYYGEGFLGDSAAYVYTKDHLGSIWQVIDDDGETVTSLTTYSPWGEQGISGAGPHSSFGYTGHFRWNDPTEVELAQYRGYDPRLGRWLSRDPLGIIDGPNLYAYVRNGPSGRRDPLGLQTVPLDPNAGCPTTPGQSHSTPVGAANGKILWCQCVCTPAGFEQRCHYRPAGGPPPDDFGPPKLPAPPAASPSPTSPPSGPQPPTAGPSPQPAPQPGPRAPAPRGPGLGGPAVSPEKESEALEGILNGGSGGEDSGGFWGTSK